MGIHATPAQLRQLRQAVIDGELPIKLVGLFSLPSSTLFRKIPHCYHTHNTSDSRCTEVYPTPSNSAAPAGCATTELHSDSGVLEVVSGPTG